jgi:hypothetical protein
MGLLDVLRGRPRQTIIPVEVTKRKAPRKRRTSLEIAVDRRILKLQSEQPALFDRIVLKKAGLGSDDEPDMLDKLFALEDKMDRRLKRRKGDQDDGGGFPAMAKAFGEGLGRVAMAYVQQGQAAARAPAPQETPMALPPGHTQPPAGEGNPHLERLIVDLVQMTPAQAADWLRGQPPPADQVVGALVRTPDERIPELVTQICAVAPRGANLLAQRTDWLIQVAQRLRQVAYNQQNPTVGESPL